MQDQQTLPAIDWERAALDLDRTGIAVTPPLLTPAQCAEVIALYEQDRVFRSTVVMARHSFGQGEYRYFAAPLHPIVAGLRQSLYPPLAQVANRWAGILDEPRFPGDLEGLTRACAAEGQHKPTPLLLRYGPGDYNCLHQDVYGDLTFPLQVAIMLNEPDADFTGGESVFVEQRPRAQSRPIVARPGRGQGLIFPVRHRPVPSARGHKRVAMRHGVSQVLSGERHVLGVIFHNAR